MPKKIVELETESDDTRPGVSHKREGSYSPNFYDDDGNLVETATYREIDEDELRERYFDNETAQYDEDDEPHLTEQQAQIAEFIGEMIVAIIVAASPHIKNWWVETAFPGIKGFARRMINIIKCKVSKDGGAQILDAEIIETRNMLPSAEQMAMELQEKNEEYRYNMSSEEAQKNLMELMALASLMAKKIDVLSHANVTDDEYMQLDEALQSETLLSNINHILLTNPKIINSQTIQGIETALNRDLFSPSGELIPIERKEMRKLLPNDLEDSEEDGGVGCRA